MKNIPLQTSPEFSPDLIGLPYISWDCWELVKFFYLKELGVSLTGPNYVCTPKSEEASRLIEIEQCNFTKVEIPEYGDIILLRIKQLNSHLGIHISKTHFLHTTEKTGSVLERYGLMWDKKIIGYYRYERH